MEQGLIVNKDTSYLIDASLIKEIIPNTGFVSIPKSNVKGLIFLREKPIYILNSVFNEDITPTQIIVMEINNFLFGLQIEQFINIINTDELKTMQHESDLIRQIVSDDKKTMLELDLNYILKEII